MRYKDYVPLYTQSESVYIKRQCSSCKEWVSVYHLDKHVEQKHESAESLGLIIQVNDIWWRKRGT